MTKQNITKRTRAVKTRPELHNLIQQQALLDLKSSAINGIFAMKSLLDVALKQKGLSIGELQKLMTMIISLSTIEIDPLVVEEVKKEDGDYQDDQKPKYDMDKIRANMITYGAEIQKKLEEDKL